MLRHVVILGLLLRAAAAQQALAKYEPPVGCYVGAFVENDPVCRGDLALFERLTGKKHACFMTYSGYGMPFPEAWISRVKRQDAAAHIGFEPNAGLGAVRDNAYLRDWARAARAAGVPIFLRFASEMNGDWEAYGGNPIPYVDKWRILARVIREEAPNVALVWCVAAGSPESYLPYYPGDEWVDWVGVTLYSVVYHNEDRAQPAALRDPRDVLRTFYQVFAERKPVMVCEYAATSFCNVVGGPTPSFAVEKMSALYQSLPAQFPRVKGINWFSLDGAREKINGNNYALTNEPLVLEAYRALTGGDYWRSRVIGEVAATPPPPAPSRPEPPVVAPLFGLQGLRQGQVVSGPVELGVFVPADWDVRYVGLLIDGRGRYLTNRQPYHIRWDPGALEPGRYSVQVQVHRDGLEPVVSEPVFVEVRRAQ
ncbi:MAG: hypothetical protein IT204_10340 [Fimbriimonadaceae bacterium]|nr:hypothetical protein [Fimbriimonadaceae bacterium]